MLRTGRMTACCAAATAAVALAGCYASTEPATEVTASSAKLNARGTANNGPAYSYFEYGPTSGTGLPYYTSRVSWPAGASGPFFDRTGSMGPLYANTEYRLRVCGNDEGKSPVCAQTRTFTTPAPVEDAVLGGWANGLGAGAPAGTVDARADPDGANPRGTLRHQLYAPSTIFRGRVTCLRVSGFTATVGAVGQRTTDGTEPDPGGPPNASSLVTVVDGGPHATDRTGVTTSSSTAPPNCAAGPTQTFGATIPAVNVYDAR